jgi:hypothetical protein
MFDGPKCLTGSVMADALAKKEDEEGDVTCRQGRRQGKAILVHQQQERHQNLAWTGMSG